MGKVHWDCESDTSMKNNRKFVVALLAMAGTFALSMVLVWAAPSAEFASHITGMWSLTVSSAVGAFSIANAVEHYTNGKNGNVSPAE